jgi:peptidase C39-like protein
MQVIARDDSKRVVRRGFRKRMRFWLIGLAALIVVSALTWYYFWPRQIASSGGLYLPYRLQLAVPRFAQGDERWVNDSLAGTQGTMGAEGCAVSSAAMVLSFYGFELDPGQLNQFLITHEGYTPEGWLRWEKAADFVPGKAKKVYEDLPSFFLIDSNLLRGNPVIIRLRLPGGVTHFVVIVGKRGFHYLIQDPGSGGEQGVYPLDELTQKIEALRFYQKMS